MKMNNCLLICEFENNELDILNLDIVKESIMNIISNTVKSIIISYSSRKNNNSIEFNFYLDERDTKRVSQIITLIDNIIIDNKEYFCKKTLIVSNFENVDMGKYKNADNRHFINLLNFALLKLNMTYDELESEYRNGE